MTASNAQGFKFDYDSQSGKYGYVVSEGGADTFVPFSSNPYQNLTGKYFTRNSSSQATSGSIPNGTGIRGTDDVTLIFPDRTMEQRSSSQYGQITCLRADGTFEYLTGYGPHTVYLGDVLFVQNNIVCTLSWTD